MNINIDWEVITDIIEGALPMGEIKNYRTNRELERLDESKYFIMRDLRLGQNKKNKNIDYVIISDHAVFVVKEKKKKGIIYGYDKDYFWHEKTLLNTHKFFNPIIENYEKINDIKKIMNSVKPLIYYNVILFSKNPEIYVEQTVESNNIIITTVDNLVDIIEEKTKVGRVYINKREIHNKIKENNTHDKEKIKSHIDGIVRESDRQMLRNLINKVT